MPILPAFVDIEAMASRIATPTSNAVPHTQRTSFGLTHRCKHEEAERDARQADHDNRHLPGFQRGERWDDSAQPGSGAMTQSHATSEKPAPNRRCEK
jgi:hypothetical protein